MKNTKAHSEFPTWLFESRILQHDWANTNVALVYSYMLARYRFHNSNQREYFESFDYISEKVRLSPRTVKKAVSLLNSNKHLEFKKRKCPSGLSNVYTIFNIYDTFSMNKTASPPYNSTLSTKNNEKRRLTFAEELEMDDAMAINIRENNYPKTPSKDRYTPLKLKPSSTRRVFDEPPF